VVQRNLGAGFLARGEIVEGIDCVAEGFFFCALGMVSTSKSPLRTLR